MTTENIAMMPTDIEHIDGSLLVHTNAFPHFEHAETWIQQWCEQLCISCKDIEIGADIVQAKLEHANHTYMLNINWTSEALWLNCLQSRNTQALSALHDHIRAAITNWRV